MKPCPCGATTYRPQPFSGRQMALRCSGCHLIVGRCRCPKPEPLDPIDVVLADLLVLRLRREKLAGETDRLRAEVYAAVLRAVELRVPYSAIATQTGLTKGMVAQIVAGGEAK